MSLKCSQRIGITCCLLFPKHKTDMKKGNKVKLRNVIRTSGVMRTLSRLALFFFFFFFLCHTCHVFVCQGFTRCLIPVRCNSGTMVHCHWWECWRCFWFGPLPTLPPSSPLHQSVWPNLVCPRSSVPEFYVKDRLSSCFWGFHFLFLSSQF